MATIILREGTNTKNNELLQVGELIYENEYFITLKRKCSLGRIIKECFSKVDIETRLDHQ